MNHFEALKLNALKAILKPDSDYFIRKVYRWYSKTFHTPLLEAIDIPFEEVLVHYFECRYEDMDEEEREEELRLALMTEEQKKEQQEADEAERLSEYQFLKMSEEINKKKAATSKLPEQVSKLTEIIDKTSEAIKNEMTSDPEELPPEIDMNFDQESFDRLINGDSLGGGKG